MTPTIKKELIIIDDDQVSNFFHSSLAKKSDCFSDIKVFRTAKKGLDFLQQRKEQNKLFDGLLIIDIEMPIMDGHELLDQIYDESLVISSCKILILTAHKSVRNFEKTKSSPLNSEFAIKPLTKQQLLEFGNCPENQKVY